MKNKPSVQSKLWIREALLELLGQKPYEEISITEIAQKAGVSRLTFYRNFKSKEDVINYHYQLGFNQLLGSVKEQPNLDLNETLIHCFQFWGTKADETRLFISRSLTNLLRQPFIDGFQQVLDLLEINESFSLFQKSFIIGGLFNAMLFYIENMDEMTPAEAASAVMSLLNVKTGQRHPAQRPV